MYKIATSAAVVALLGNSVNGRQHHHHRAPPVSYIQFIDNLDVDEKDAIKTANSLKPTSENMGNKGYEKALNKAIKQKINNDSAEMEKHPVVPGFIDIDKVNNEFLVKKFPEMRDQLKVEEPVRATKKQSMAQSSSDPIYGSLGAPKVPRKDLFPDQQLEWDLRHTPPPVYTDDEDIKTNDNSVKIAEKMIGAKMALPTDPKQMAKMIKTPEYEMADSDDEEADTIETRRSIKTAEKQLKTRFFINAKDKNSFEDEAYKGKIDKKILDFAEDKDVDIHDDPKEKQEKEVKAKAKALEKQKKMKEEMEDTSSPQEKAEKKKEEASAEKAQAAKEKADPVKDAPAGDSPKLVAKKTQKAIQAEEAAKTSPPEPAPAEGEDFIPPELRGEMEVVKEEMKKDEKKKEEKKAAEHPEGEFIPPELMGNMEAVHDEHHHDDFMPPELMGDMEVVAVQIAQKKQVHDLHRELNSV